jgi:hypothetical protein
MLLLIEEMPKAIKCVHHCQSASFSHHQVVRRSSTAAAICGAAPAEFTTQALQQSCSLRKRLLLLPHVV